MKLKPVVICALILTSAVLMAIPGRTKAAGPTFSDITWSPKYPWPGAFPPSTGDKINVTATIEDPTGINFLNLLYCSIPGGLCTTWGMESAGGSKYYNKSLTVFANATGGDIQIVATNGNGEQNSTALYYIAYALSVNATMSSDHGSVYPGGLFNLTVSAHYWNNTSAMAEYSQVNVTRVGSTEHWNGVTNATGECKIAVTAPLAVSTYRYNASVTNRTLTGYANEQTIAVQIEPLPDLEVRAEDIVYSPHAPTEGDNITANITIHNIGTDNDTFEYSVTLNTGGSKVKWWNSTITIHAGSTAVVHVWWIVVAGKQWLNVTLDPDNDSRELNEQNNNASVLITASKLIKTDGNQGFFTPEVIAVVVVVIPVLIVVAILAVLLPAMKAARRKKAEQLGEPSESPNEEDQPPE